MSELTSTSDAAAAPAVTAPATAAKKGKKGPASEVPRFGRVKSHLKVCRNVYNFTLNFSLML